MSAPTVHETLRLLRAVQDQDLSIYRLQAELQRLPAERDKRQIELQNRESVVREHQARQADLKARLKEIEDHTTIQRQRLRKLEREATNSKADTALVMAYQHEMRNLKRDISTAEEEGLNFVEQMDALQGQIDALQKDLDQELALFKEYSANVDAEMAAAKEKLAGLEEERRSRLSESLERDVLSRYEGLLKAREGQALAMLEGRICQECYIEVPPNVFVRLSRGAELVQCPTCDRILYLPEM